MDILPIDPGARRAILDAVAAQQAEAESLLATLVAFPSTLGHEAWCLDFCARAFAALGLDVRRIPTEPEKLGSHPGWSPPLVPYGGRDNAVGLYTPRETKGRSLCLQGHIDVVPEGAAEAEEAMRLGLEAVVGVIARGLDDRLICSRRAGQPHRSGQHVPRESRSLPTHGGHHRLLRGVVQQPR